MRTWCYLNQILTLSLTLNQSAEGCHQGSVQLHHLQEAERRGEQGRLGQRMSLAET